MGTIFYTHFPQKLIQLGEVMISKGAPIWKFQHAPKTLIHSSLTPEKVWFTEPVQENSGRESEMEFVVLDWMTIEVGHPLRDVCHILMQIDEEVFGAQLEGYLHYYYSELVKQNPLVRQSWSLAQCENDFLVALLAAVDYAVNSLGEDLNANSADSTTSLLMKGEKIAHVLQKISCFGVNDISRALDSDLL